MRFGRDVVLGSQSRQMVAPRPSSERFCFVGPAGADKRDGPSDVTGKELIEGDGVRREIRFD